MKSLGCVATADSILCCLEPSLLNPNAAKLFIDFVLSEEGQKQLVDLSRIPVREDVKPQPARLFGGYKRIVENPGEYENFSEVIKLYQEIFNVR